MARLSADCRRDTSSGEGLSDVMSQASPTLCIQAPKSETRPAIHSALKTVWVSGRHADTGAASALTGPAYSNDRNPLSSEFARSDWICSRVTAFLFESGVMALLQGGLVRLERPQMPAGEGIVALARKPYRSGRRQHGRPLRRRNGLERP